MPVRDRPVRSDPAAVTAVTNGPVPRAGFGGFIGVQARRAFPGAQALAQGAEDAAFKIDRIANAATGLTPDTDVPKAIADKPSRSAPAPRPPGG